MSPHALRHVLDDGAYLCAFRGPRRTQDRHDRRAARHVIDVHRCEAALVVMGVPERELLTAVRGTEGVVDVENLQLAGLHGRAELIDQRRGQPRRLRLARRILQTADRRLRGQRCTAVRAAADRELHQWIVPQPVEVDGILVAAGNRRGARHHHLENFVTDAACIAPIRHCIRKPPAHTKLALRLPQQQQAGIRRLVAASDIAIRLEILVEAIEQPFNDAGLGELHSEQSQRRAVGNAIFDPRRKKPRERQPITHLIFDLLV